MSDRNNNPHNNYDGQPRNFGSRQQARRARFERVFAAFRDQYGRGQMDFSWVEGMTRRAARRVARKLSRSVPQPSPDAPS